MILVMFQNISVPTNIDKEINKMYKVSQKRSVLEIPSFVAVPDNLH